MALKWEDPDSPLVRGPTRGPGYQLRRLPPATPFGTLDLG
jgi:hypothetical protein